jgi:hypothetical protein
MLEIVHFRDDASLHSRTWSGVRARVKSLLDKDRAATHLRTIQDLLSQRRKSSIKGPLVDRLSTLLRLQLSVAGFYHGTVDVSLRDDTTPRMRQAVVVASKTLVAFECDGSTMYHERKTGLCLPAYSSKLHTRPQQH